MQKVTIKYPFGPTEDVTVPQSIADQYRKHKKNPKSLVALKFIEDNYAVYPALTARLCNTPGSQYPQVYSRHIYPSAITFLNTDNLGAAWEAHRKRTDYLDIDLFKLCDALFDAIHTGYVDTKILHNSSMFDAHKNKVACRKLRFWIFGPPKFTEMRYLPRHIFLFVAHGGSKRATCMNSIHHLVRNGFHVFAHDDLPEPMTTMAHKRHLPLFHLPSMATKNHPWYKYWLEDDLERIVADYQYDRNNAEVTTFSTDLTKYVTFLKNYWITPTNMNRLPKMQELRTLQCYVNSVPRLVLLRALEAACPRLNRLIIDLNTLDPIERDKKQDDANEEEKDLPVFDHLEYFQIACEACYGFAIRAPILQFFSLLVYYGSAIKNPGNLEVIKKEWQPFLHCRQISIDHASVNYTVETVRYLANSCKNLHSLKVNIPQPSKQHFPRAQDFISPNMGIFISHGITLFNVCGDQLMTACIAFAYRYRQANLNHAFSRSYVALLPGLILAAFNKTCKIKNETQRSLRYKRRKN